MKRVGAVILVNIGVAFLVACGSEVEKGKPASSQDPNEIGCQPDDRNCGSNGTNGSSGSSGTYDGPNGGRTQDGTGISGVIINGGGSSGGGSSSSSGSSGESSSSSSSGSSGESSSSSSSGSSGGSSGGSYDDGGSDP